MDPTYAVFCGIDVGKGEHHAVALDPSGTRLFDKALPNDEAKLRAVFDRLAEHGPVLVIVDQPNTIGALPVTVARACGHAVAYLPGGLTMRRVADLYPGQAKTDARDAFIIADTARTMPHTLRRVDVGDETSRNSGCSSGSTTISPVKPPGSATVSVDCSPESIPPSNAFSVRGSRIRLCSKSCRNAAGRSASAKPASADSPHSQPSTPPHGWAPDWPRKSSPHSMPKQ